MKSKQESRKFETFEWIDVTNPNSRKISEIAEAHHFDPMLLHDSVEHGHLPKIEKLPNYTFVILRAYSARKNEMVTTVGELSNKIAFFVKPNLLLTIHRANFSFLDSIDGDYNHLHELMLDIIQRMVDTYDDPLGVQMDKIDDMEKIVFLKSGESISVQDLYYQKSKARISKKLLVMTQTVLLQIEIDPSFHTRSQDIKDSLTHAILLYEEVNEDANNLLNAYLSITAQKNNDVMKLLTVFSAFFLPLTFIAGIYGMNFENMPELEWSFGYFAALGAMAAVGIVIYLWFRRKKFF